MSDSNPTEPGRHVTDDDRIVYAWPPEGRFAVLWRRIQAALPDEVERLEAAALLDKWRDETSTLVAYADIDGEWVEVEPDWDVPDGWLNGG